MVVVADRAYALPALVDRLQGYGWHWVLRVGTRGAHRWQAAHGGEQALAAVVTQHLPHPGTRWRTTGAFGKKAGWRTAHLVGVWGRGAREPLVVLTDLPPRWAVLGRMVAASGSKPASGPTSAWAGSGKPARCAISTTSRCCCWGWRGPVWWRCVWGPRRLPSSWRRCAVRPGPRMPARACASRGILAIRHWLYQGRAAPMPWVLPEPDGPSWTAQWSAAQSRAFIFHVPVRP